jgi:hypothetical protein
MVPVTPKVRPRRLAVETISNLAGWIAAFVPCSPVQWLF